MRKHVFSVEVHLPRVVEVDILVLVLGWRVGEFAREHCVDWEEGVAEFGMLQHSISIFIKHLQKVVHIAPLNPRKFQHLRQTIINFFQSNLAIAVHVKKTECVNQVEVLSAGELYFLGLQHLPLLWRYRRRLLHYHWVLGWRLLVLGLLLLLWLLIHLIGIGVV